MKRAWGRKPVNVDTRIRRRYNAVLRFGLFPLPFFQTEDSVVTLIKIIIITLAVILSILLFGRFLF